MVKSGSSLKPDEKWFTEDCEAGLPEDGAENVDPYLTDAEGSSC